MFEKRTLGRLVLSFGLATIFTKVDKRNQERRKLKEKEEILDDLEEKDIIVIEIEV